jgi:hypothetical protein
VEGPPTEVAAECRHRSISNPHMPSIGRSRSFTRRRCGKFLRLAWAVCWNVASMGDASATTDIDGPSFWGVALTVRSEETELSGEVLLYASSRSEMEESTSCLTPGCGERMRRRSWRSGQIIVLHQRDGMSLVCGALAEFRHLHRHSDRCQMMRTAD